MRGAEVQEEYLRLAPHLSRFAELGTIRLQELLVGDVLRPASPVQSRVKTLESVLAKLERKGDGSGDLTLLRDLVGFRLVVAYRRELEPACQVVEDAFRVDAREGPALTPDRFGYSSIHISVRPPYEWKLPSNLVGEVQVRTLAQHLWAHASHDLQYKVEDQIPQILRRSVNRAAALLELVDLEFERVLAEREEIERTLAGPVENEEPITLDSIRAVLDTLWPASHRHEGEEYGFLLYELQEHGVGDTRRLATIIQRHRPAVLDYARRYAERFLRNIDKHGLRGGELKISRPARTLVAGGITAAMVARLRQGVFFSHVALTSTALAVEFSGRDLDHELLD